MGWARAALVGAVVVIVTFAVAELEPVMFTWLVELKLKVGGYRAPVGLEEMAAVSATMPVKPPTGAMVIVDVFPLVAPGATETGVPLTVKLELTAVVTVTELMPVAAL